MYLKWMRLLVFDINRHNVNVVQKVYTYMKVKAKWCPLIKKWISETAWAYVLMVSLYLQTVKPVLLTSCVQSHVMSSQKRWMSYWVWQETLVHFYQRALAQSTNQRDPNAAIRSWERRCWGSNGHMKAIHFSAYRLVPKN